MGTPAPILVKLYKSNAHWYWALAALGVVGLWIIVALIGYGDLQSPLAIAPTPLVGAHIAFAAVAAYCALTAQSLAWANARLPFVTGTFLFPSGVIVVRSSGLTIAPIEELQDVRATGSSVQVVFPGRTFSFVADQSQANAAPAMIQEARQKYQAARAANDIRQLLLLDPLQDSGVPNPLAPTEPLAPPRLMARWTSIVAVVVAGVALGSAVFWVRNTWSAKALYVRALAADSTQAYRDYLERGGKRPEVEAILLPRAELKDARAKNSVEAIEAYIKAHPQTRIAQEITDAHRAALLRVLDKAKAAGTLSALNQLEQKHKGYPLIQAELQAAKQALYDGAFAKFKAQASDKPEIAAFVQRLIHYSQVNGPKVEVRFQVKYTQNYDHIEDIVEKSPYYVGPSILPAQFFKGKYVEAREQRIGKALVERLQKAFPEDVLDFELGPSIPSEQGDLPEVKVPTLFVEHSVSFSGGFVGLKRQGMYMGMTLAYRAFFRIPGQEADQLVYQIRLWRAPKQELIDGAKNAEEIYDSLATDAYDTFLREYLEHWFKKP